jgi:kinesin family protein 2/24
MENMKNEKMQEEKSNRENGNFGDVDFQRMIRQYRQLQLELQFQQAHTPPGETKICICVRKRPISTKEIKKNDFDSVTCLNPVVVVHDCKLKIDGIAKFLDNSSFEFDHTFDENDSTDDVYFYAVKSLVYFNQ